METTLFLPRPLIKKSMLQRLLRQEPKANAIIEVNNLLAKGGISAVSPLWLKEINLQYGITVQQMYALNLQEFYAVAWNRYLKETSSPEKDAEFLTFRHLLGIDDSNAAMLESDIAASRYSTVARYLLADGRFPHEHAVTLDALRKRVRLPQHDALKLLASVQVEVFQKFLKDIKLRERCTPKEWERMELMLREFALSDSTVKQEIVKLDRFKKYWDLEHLPLPIIPSDAVLQKSEFCFFKAKGVDWNEERGSGYHKQYERINRGTLYLTDKRLVFEGEVKNSTLAYDRVIGVSKQDGGLLLRKDKGKNPVLIIPGDSETAFIIFKRLIA